MKKKTEYVTEMNISRKRKWMAVTKYISSVEGGYKILKENIKWTKIIKFV